MCKGTNNINEWKLQTKIAVEAQPSAKWFNSSNKGYN